MWVSQGKTGYAKASRSAIENRKEANPCAPFRDEGHRGREKKREDSVVARRIYEMPERVSYQVCGTTSFERDCESRGINDPI
jgi:hypothetical protein